MIDFHTHILPGIDDGSKSSDMSLDMLREEASQGTDTVCATPHFYADRMSVDKFLSRRDDALGRVVKKAQASKEALPDILTGAEVYYFQGIGSAKALPKLTLQGTDTLLLEMPFMPWDRKVLQDVKELIFGQGLTVVLAHVERYVEFQKDKTIWNEIFSLPVIPQINTGSFIEKKRLLRKDRTYAFCVDFARSAPKLILGSDCHNMEMRRPNLKEGRDALSAALGEAVLETVDKTTKEVCQPVR